LAHTWNKHGEAFTEFVQALQQVSAHWVSILQRTCHRWLHWSGIFFLAFPIDILSNWEDFAALFLLWWADGHLFPLWWPALGTLYNQLTRQRRTFSVVAPST